MAQSPDHPELQFVQAKGYTKGRPDGPPLWIVIHDMEAGESSTRAESTAAYFANPGDGRSVSAHYCVDDNSVVQCVLLKDVAWTVGNRPGNNRGINWELAGFARQTRAEWLDPFGLAMFAEMAPIVRADAAKYGIPLRRCSVADLKAFRPGVTSHNDLRLAFDVTTHTDPGPNFPWDVFLQMMEDDMPITIADADLIISRFLATKLGASGPTCAVAWQDAYRYSKATAADVDLDPDELLAIGAVVEKSVPTADEIAAAIVAKLPAGALTQADVEEAVRAVFADAGSP